MPTTTMAMHAIRYGDGFFKRHGAMEILVFVMLYKLPTLMATALTTVFLMELGFEKVEIAAVAKVAGLIATIVGTLAGGALMVRLGIKAALWVLPVVIVLAAAGLAVVQGGRKRKAASATAAEM